MSASSSEDDDMYGEIKQSLIEQIRSSRFSDDDEEVLDQRIKTEHAHHGKKTLKDQRKQNNSLKIKNKLKNTVKAQQGKLKTKTKHKSKLETTNNDSEGLRVEKMDAVDKHDFDTEKWEDENSEEYFESSEDESKDQSKSANKRMEEFKSKLGITDEDIFNSRRQNELQKIKNKPKRTITASFTAQKKRPPPEIVVFEDPAKRKNKATSSLKRPQRPGDESDDDDDFDLKRARYEVRKLGIEAMESKSKEEAKLALLMSLGAKPPKNKYINYTELQVQKKQEREDEIKKLELLRDLGYKMKKATKQPKKKRDINDVGHLDGQVGRYKQGVQVISKSKIGAKS